MDSIAQIVQPFAPPAASRGGPSGNLTGVEFAAEFQWRDKELPVSGLPGPGLDPWQTVWSEDATPPDAAVPPAPVVMTDHDLAGDASDREAAGLLVALHTRAPEPPGDTPEVAPSLQLHAPLPPGPPTPSALSVETAAAALTGPPPSGEIPLSAIRDTSAPAALSPHPAPEQTVSDQTGTRAIAFDMKQDVPVPRGLFHGLAPEPAPPDMQTVAPNPDDSRRTPSITLSGNTPVPKPDAALPLLPQDEGAIHRVSNMDSRIAEGRVVPALRAPSHEAQTPVLPLSAVPQPGDGNTPPAHDPVPDITNSFPAHPIPRSAGPPVATPKQGNPARPDLLSGSSVPASRPTVTPSAGNAAPVSSPILTPRNASSDGAKPSEQVNPTPGSAAAAKHDGYAPDRHAAPRTTPEHRPPTREETQVREGPVFRPHVDPPPRQVQAPAAPVTHPVTPVAHPATPVTRPATPVRPLPEDPTARRSSLPPSDTQTIATQDRLHWQAAQSALTPKRDHPSTGTASSEPFAPAEQPTRPHPAPMADAALKPTRVDRAPTTHRPYRDQQIPAPSWSFPTPQSPHAGSSAMTQQPPQPRPIAVSSPQPIPTAAPEPSVPQAIRPRTDLTVTATVPLQRMLDMAATGVGDLVSAPDPLLPASAHADIRPTEPAAIPRPDPVSTQLAQRIAAVPMMTDRDAPLELTLDPPELGAIRVSVSRGTEGMVLHLQADLPETLDLLRRNGAALMQELQRQGLDHAGFSFSGRDPGGQQHRPDAQPLGAREDDAQIHPTHSPEPSQIASARTRQSGLDIRL